MRHLGGLAAFLIVGMLVMLDASSSDAQPFYTGSGNNMFRVFGCAPNATLNLNGTGPTQQGDCTSFETSTMTPAVPIETWVSAQVTGLQAQNEKLQRQVEELTARVRALESSANQPPRSTAPRPESGSTTK